MIETTRKRPKDAGPVVFTCPWITIRKDRIGASGSPLDDYYVVERFFAWIGRNRRLAKDFEATVDSARAFLYAASVMLLVRRLARAS